MKKILFGFVISFSLFINPSVFASNWSIGSSGGQININYSSGGGSGSSSFDKAFDSVGGGGGLPQGEFELPAPEEYNTIGENTSIRDFIQKVLNFILSFLGLIAIIAIIYAGYMYITAGGDDGQTEKAKKTIIYAIIGLIVVVISYALVNTILKEAITGGDDRAATGGGQGSSGQSGYSSNGGSSGQNGNGGNSGSIINNSGISTGSYYQVGASVKTGFAPGTTIKAGTKLPNGQTLSTDKVVREDGTIEIETGDITNLNPDTTNEETESLFSFDNGITVKSSNGGTVKDQGEYVVVSREVAQNGLDFGIGMQALVIFDFGDGIQARINTIDNPDDTAKHSFGLNSNYLIRAIAETKDGKQYTFSKNLVIDPTVIDFRVSKTNVAVDEFIDFSALAKTTIGEVKGFKWTCEGENGGCFGDTQGEAISASFGAPGSYQVTLLVGNTIGTEATVTKEITVFGTPTASIRYRSTNNKNQPMEYEFSAADSRNSTGASLGLTYKWTFEGQEKTTTEPNIKHTFSKDGSQEVSLQVLEKINGKTLTSEVVVATIDVKAKLNPDFQILQ